MSSLHAHPDPVEPLTGDPEGSPTKLRAAIGSGIGTTVENFDFVAYGTASALYFGTAFFREGDPVVGTLLAFVTYAVGFAARPLGGIIGGVLADRVGRRPVLIGSLMVMGGATTAIGLLPTYAQVGVLAPILLTVVRIIQGFAFGAEWGGAVLMTYEHAPWKRKGLYCAIPQAGVPFGNLLAALAFLVSTLLPGDWAWRAPFLVSFLLIVVGIVIRFKVSESPSFEAVRDRGQLKANPLVSVLREDWRSLIRAVLLRASENAGYAIGITYVSSYVVQVDPDHKSLSAMAIAIAAAVGCAAVPLWALLTDRIGRRSVYMIGASLMIIIAAPVFLLVDTGLVGPTIIAFLGTFCLVENCLAAAQPTWFAELFPTNTRATGVSIAYQVAAIIGGFTPLIGVALYLALGLSGPAMLYACFGVLGLVTAFFTKETLSRRRREEIDRRIAAVRAAPDATDAQQPFR